ncbi:MAG: hypothetical protein JXQ26_10475 [Tissierellales bacterium]|nr:hypothetical protein [Tissierellales bacterium]MBN2828409.1 hypothetical protein [Tissierellales bacterium]
MSLNNMQRDLELTRCGQLDINLFISKYKPFIYSIINQYKGSYVSDGDELSTIGMMAFKEAYDNYDELKGNFYNYSKMVIRSRLIDYFRKENKYQMYEKNFIDNEESHEYKSDIIESKEAVDQYNIEQENFYRREEIKLLIEELKNFDITLSDLEKICPKKQDLIDRYRKSADFVVENKTLLKGFLENQRLPASEITENVFITKKQLDRGRKYVMALIIIKKGDYELLADYIK